ncbi:DUF397 domain-containing protein [Streptomyces iconiensis]|uniref:DUF397 domain-containing protein n=1 Tax=Streptomyces iconiensis TaxID=1384038 RepID=A0ABT6ZP49_9ACTN|nr:DUF397 domain-containing protein [Streptomyces iconiensis]MDJ1130833.1 DUF397 domain-containing protein [Streptomyces iconiensis]
MSTAHDLSAAIWRTSSYTNGEGGACVQVADGFPEIMPVRDSKLDGDPTLIFPTQAWGAFVTAVKGNFLSA